MKNLGAPRGVNGRNSDNTAIKKEFGWEPSTRRREGLQQTYRWIHEQMLKDEQGAIAVVNR